jgi:hypothetical protein
MYCLAAHNLDSHIERELLYQENILGTVRPTGTPAGVFQNLTPLRKSTSFLLMSHLFLPPGEANKESSLHSGSYIAPRDICPEQRTLIG